MEAFTIRGYHWSCSKELILVLGGTGRAEEKPVPPCFARLLHSLRIKLALRPVDLLSPARVDRRGSLDWPQSCRRESFEKPVQRLTRSASRCAALHALEDHAPASGRRPSVQTARAGFFPGTAPGKNSGRFFQRHEPLGGEVDHVRAPPCRFASVGNGETLAEGRLRAQCATEVRFYCGGAGALDRRSEGGASGR